MIRRIIAYILRLQSVFYLRRRNIPIVAVVGSVGKTSTTQAIATILEQEFRVRKTIKNYNSDIGVPFSIFDMTIPESLKNPFVWFNLLLRIQIKSLRKPSFDVLVLELGTDKPGEIAAFSWLRPDIAVVTAVAPEHMEFFKTIEAVAGEELSVSAYSTKTYINYLTVDEKHTSYLSSDESVFYYSRKDISDFDIDMADLQVIGAHSVDAIVAGLVVGRELGVDKALLKNAALSIRPQKGRMNVLLGVKQTNLIDDTYNSSPEAVYAALDYLYSIKNSQRIALLGTMNELGDVSAEEHTKIGQYCDPKKLDLVVTIGRESNQYTAEAARKKGCHVRTSTTPYEAANIILKHIKNGATVLFKGSQNGVYAEEAVKMLLKDPKDEKYLVRQSKQWMKKKNATFKDMS